MSEMLIAAAAILAAIFAPRVMPDSLVGWRRTGADRRACAWFSWLVALYEVLATSIISIPANQVGVVRKIYGFANIAPGHIIAAQGETGYQAEIIPPGTFRISIFFNVLNRIDLLPVVIVPSGFYGRIVASDGQPLSAGQIMADAWPEGDYQKFLDAQYFMTHGGQKGLQLSVLKPGVYPLNLALYQVKIGYIRNSKDVVANNDDVYDLRGLTQGGHAARHVDHPRAGRLGRRRALERARRRHRLQGAHRQDRRRRPDGGAGDPILQGRLGYFAAAQRLLSQPRRL